MRWVEIVSVVEAVAEMFGGCGEEEGGGLFGFFRDKDDAVLLGGDWKSEGEEDEERFHFLKWLVPSEK